MDYPLRTLGYALATVTFIAAAVLPVIGLVPWGGELVQVGLFAGLAFLAFGPWVGSLDDQT